MKKAKKLSLIVSFAFIINIFASVLPAGFSLGLAQNVSAATTTPMLTTTPTITTTSSALVVDNFDNANQFNVNKQNDLGANIDIPEQVDGTVITATCDGTELTVEGTPWWYMSTDLGGDVDVNNYTDLVIDIKGSVDNTAQVSLCSNPGWVESGNVNLNVTTSWQTLRLPLSSFTGLNKSAAVQIKLVGLKGTVEFKSIRFDVSSETNTPTPTTTPSALVVDNFDNADQFNINKKNDLGDKIDIPTEMDGTAITATCDGTELSVQGTAWWYMSTDLGSGVDISNYSDLVFEIKGSSADTVKVALCSDPGWAESGAEDLKVTTSWKTVRLPLSGFSGLQKSAVRQIKLTDLTGAVEFKSIRFEVPAAPTIPEAIVVDDFNDTVQFNSMKNDLGCNINIPALIDGTTITTKCDGTELSVQGTPWWYMSTDLGGLDLSNYSDLVFEIKGSVDNTAQVSLCSNPGWAESGKANLTMTTSWQTLRLPLSSFSGLNKANLVQLKLVGLKNTVEIKSIRFEATTIPGGNQATVIPEVSKLIFDDFNDTAQFETTKVNDIGGGYWGDGVRTCTDGVASFNGTTWLDCNLKPDESGVDLRNYAYLVYKIKGPAGATMTVNLWNKFGTVNVQIPITTDWQTVKIPLSSFTGLEKARVVKMKHNFVATGAIEIDEIGFEAESPKVVDDYNSDTQFNTDKKNDLGGLYYADNASTASCDGTSLNISGTSYMNIGLNGPLDISKYTHLVLSVKGSVATSIHASIENSALGTASSVQDIPVTTQWKTIQLPIKDILPNIHGFTGLDETKALTIKLVDLSGTIQIQKISFEALAAYGPENLPALPPPPPPVPEEEPDNDGTKTIIDDFNNASKLVNDLGGQYWGDGTRTCDATKETLSGVKWWNIVLNKDTTGVDLTQYAALTFVIKGTSGATMNVSLKDNNAKVNTTPQIIPISTSWRTVQIPLSNFTGPQNNTKIVELDCNGFNGTIDIDEIRLDKTLMPTPPPIKEPTPPSWPVHAIGYTPAPIDNPLKGLLPFAPEAGDSITNFELFPHSMEWSYLPLNEIMTGDNTFDFAKVEDLFNQIAARGHQAAFRVYLDYPGRTSGIPKFLLDDSSIVKHSYSEYGNVTSVSPDYDNPKIIKALVDFIHAFAAKYDGDPRLGYMTTGLIGFWGEWHTYPYNADSGQNWMPSEEHLNTILKAFDDSFNKTKILTRYPMAGSTEMDMGYHDDSFAYSTLMDQSWNFLPTLINTGADEKWMTNPIGGELRPEIQRTIWNSNPPGTGTDQAVTGAQDYISCVDLTHATWMISHAVFKNPLSGDALTRALEGSRRLGYEYYVPNAYYSNNVTVGSPLNIGVEIQNKGIAPFYYNWEVQLGAKDQSGNIIKTWTTDWKISNIIPISTDPTAKAYYTKTIDNPGIAFGKYTLVMKVINPLEVTHSNASKFRFANTTQGADGWLNLGSVSIDAPILGGDTQTQTPTQTPTPAPTPTPTTTLTNESITVKAVTDSSTGKATAKVEASTLKDLVDKLIASGRNAAVEIKVDVVTGTKAVTVEIPRDAFTKVAAKTDVDVKVDAGIGSVSFNANAVNSISGAADAGNIFISISKVQASTLTPEVQSKVGDRPVFDFTAKAGSSKIPMFGNGKAEINIPYTLKVGEKKNSIVVYDIDSTGKLITIRGKYDSVTKTVNFKTSHFAQYAIGYNEVVFKDVAANDWFNEAVGFMSSRDIINGVGESKFAPAKNVTRADFLIMVMNSYGIEIDTTATDNFVDAGNKYYTKYLGTAKRLDIVSGVGNNKYAPEATLSRQDMIVILYSVLNKLGEELPAASSGKSLASFNDSGDIVGYAENAMKLFVENGAMAGDGNNLNPKATSTRAQVAQVIYNLISK